MNKFFANQWQKASIEYLASHMSLRQPQKKSLELLETICSSLDLHAVKQEKVSLNDTLKDASSIFPQVKSFERQFPSLAFALATGVGKTRLMGAFIAYLFSNYGIKHFLIVAPGNTVYKKLLCDFSEISGEKYVFRGLINECMPEPIIYSKDDFDQQRLLTDTNDLQPVIFLFNIDKFSESEKNKDGTKVLKTKKPNEFISGGKSFYEHLSSYEDLVILMDESHHYHGEAGATTLDGLAPLMGLELTATPLYSKGSRQIKFQNVVYEYSLRESVKDGFARSLTALARLNLTGDRTDDEWEKLMLNEGISHHIKIKKELADYANLTNKKLVKPFVLVVCKDTTHANEIEKYIKSPEFFGGEFADKVITLTSKLTPKVKEENEQKLAEVELSENPIEIVINVNILKEGWDVNNLYTIIPLRTAASDILTQQIAGRGVRLSFGEQTGIEIFDTCYITAHKNFQALIDEAKSGASAIDLQICDQDKDEKTFIVPQLVFDFNAPEEKTFAQKKCEEYCIEPTEEHIKNIQEIIFLARKTIHSEATKKGHLPSNQQELELVKNEIKKQIQADPRFVKAYIERSTLFDNVIAESAEIENKNISKLSIPVPIVKQKITETAKRYLDDFVLDTCNLPKATRSTNKLKYHDLIKNEEKEEIIDAISMEQNPKLALLNWLYERPEVNSATDGKLLAKLVDTALAFYSDNDLANCFDFISRDIESEIYKQILQHLKKIPCKIEEKITEIRYLNFLPDNFSAIKTTPLDTPVKKDVPHYAFTGARKNPADRVHFDSLPEKDFAVILEYSTNVQKWIRVTKREFETLQYTDVDEKTKSYVPDFLVETDEKIYIVEIKGKHMLQNPDVLAKKEIAKKYCKLVNSSPYVNSKLDKKYYYLFISDDEISQKNTAPKDFTYFERYCLEE